MGVGRRWTRSVPASGKRLLNLRTTSEAEKIIKQVQSSTRLDLFYGYEEIFSCFVAVFFMRGKPKKMAIDPQTKRRNG